MKIRVIVDKYEHQGLYKGSEHESTYDPETHVYSFMNYGKLWALDVLEAIEVDLLEESDFPSPNEKLMDVINTDLKKTPIKSDGGSSSYYDIDIPAWLLYTLNERQKEGKCYIKTEELIECGFSSDFDAGNIFKSLVRAWGALNGAGKAGNGVDYECNKIVYSANKLKQRNQRKEQK